MTQIILLLSLKRPDKHERLTQREESQITKIHQAIAMIQFKLEIPIIKRRPNFEMEERLVLEKVNYDTNEITVYGNTYPLKDTCFQTINRNNPAELLPEEEEVMNKLLLSFQQSEKLRRHMSFLMRKVRFTYHIMVIYSFMVVFQLMKMVRWNHLKLMVILTAAKNY